MNLDYESAAKYFFICMAIWAPVLAPVVQKKVDNAIHCV